MTTLTMLLAHVGRDGSLLARSWASVMLLAGVVALATPALSAAAPSSYRLYDRVDFDGWSWSARDVPVAPTFFSARTGKELKTALSQIADIISKNPIRVDSHVLLDPQGNLYVQGTQGRNAGDVRKFSPRGLPSETPLLSTAVYGVIGPSGKIYHVVNGDLGGRHAVETLSLATGKPTGTFIAYPGFADLATGTGEAFTFGELAFDPSGNLYSTGFYEHYENSEERGSPAGDDDSSPVPISKQGERLLKISPTGAVLFDIGVGVDDGVHALAVGPTGNVYLSVDCRAGVDSPDTCGAGQIRKFSPQGEPIGQWATTMSAQAIAVDSADNLFEVDEDAGRILKYSPTGKLLTALVATGTSRTAMKPRTVVIDRRTDDVYSVGNASVVYRWMSTARTRAVAKCDKLVTSTTAQRKASGRCYDKIFGK